MPSSLRAFVPSLCCWLLPLAAMVAARPADGRPPPPARAEALLADVSAVTAGKPFTVGVLMKMAPQWHIYWTNPGDAGAPTVVSFKAPAGFTVGPTLYPAPQRFGQVGGIAGYGYAHQVLLMATITPPAQTQGQSVPIEAEVSWLACEAVCIQGRARVGLTLPVAGEGAVAAAANEALFSRFRAQVPLSGAAAAQVAGVRVSAATRPADADERRFVGLWRLQVQWSRGVKEAQFIPGPSDVLEVHSDAVRHEGRTSELAVRVDRLLGPRPTPRTLPGVIVFIDERGERRGIEIELTLNKV